MKSRHRTVERQWQRPFLAVAWVAFLAACDPGAPAVPLRYQEDPKASKGMVATDEPRATLVGESILMGGGTAGDAAAAIGLALAVTYPAAAGFGGGGACLAYDPRTNAAHSVEFLPRPAAAGGDAAVPGLARGLGAVHGRYGRMPVGQVVAPAENLARFGTQASRAFIRRLEATRDGDLARLWRTEHLQPLAVGRAFSQPELANVLAALRVRGFGSLYVGAGARSLAEGFASAGGKVTMEDVRDYGVEWREAQALRSGEAALFVGAGTLLGSEGVAAGWRGIVLSGAYEKASAEAKREIVLRSAPPAPGGEAGGATSFVVVDKNGLAIACALTMGAEFGARRMVEGQGFLAAKPAAGGDLAAYVLATTTLKRTFSAGAASGPGAAAALVSSVGPLWLENLTADAGIANRAAAGDARVNLVYCPFSIPSSDETCYPGTDPRGHGLATGGVK